MLNCKDANDNIAILFKDCGEDQKISTNSTDKSWFWYVRKAGKNWVLGLIDHTGTAPASALDIEYWYDKVPDEITSEDDIIDVPIEYEHGFLMGVVDEVMRMLGTAHKLEKRRSRMGNYVNTYRADFEDAIYDAIHKNVDETQQPLTIAPLDLRMDENQITTRSPEL